MNFYRLLRSNKESGPYTEEDIIALGFKPYDLIWVEGKSAGWRYPSELPEFKMYAPVTEEQPYDRFYKKHPSQQVAASGELEKSTESLYQVSSSSPVNKAQEASEPLPGKLPTINPASIGRHIHVTLPSGSRVNVTTVSTKKEEVKEKMQPQPYQEKVPSFAESISPSYPALAKENNSAYVHAENIAVEKSIPSNTAYHYPSPPVAGFSLTMILGLTVGIATFVGLGLMIGLSINRTKTAETALNSTINKKSSRPPTLPAAISVPSVDEENRGPDINRIEPRPIPENNNKNKIIVKNDRVNTAATPLHIQTANNNRSLVQPNIQKENKSATAEESKKQDHKNVTEAVPYVNLEKQVNVNNAYKVGAFGGISDLQCTVSNESKFVLDIVEVEVAYIQANDKVFKTEKLSFRDVPAGTQITLNAPKSPRGVKVLTRVTKISSKESGLASNAIRS